MFKDFFIPKYFFTFVSNKNINMKTSKLSLLEWFTKTELYLSLGFTQSEIEIA